MNQPPKFHISLLGMNVGAEGVIGIAAAVLIVFMLLFRFDAILF